MLYSVVEMIDYSQVNIHDSLKRHLPSLTSLVGDRDFAWVLINRKFIEHMAGRHDDYVGGGNHLLVPINFYDVITQTLLGNGNYHYLFTYFDNVLKELNQHIPEDKKFLVRGILKNMLINMDMRFLNFVGELSILNNLIKTGFRLEKVEELLPNGKRVDFTVQSAQGITEMVEVVNIFLEGAEEYDDGRLIQFVKGKLLNKYKDQSKNELAIPFTLVPVLWGTHSMLLRLKNLYDQHLNLTSENIHEPMAYSCIIYGNRFNIKFSKLSNVFVIP